MTPLIAADSVYKTYRLGKVRVPVLRGASLAADEGSFVAVLGKSGSGKSTLLHLLGGLDRPDADADAGRGNAVLFRGEPLSRFGAVRLDRYRAGQVGFIFQFYHLLPELSTLENVLAGSMVGVSRISWMRRRRDTTREASDLLARFGLGHRLKHRPNELSGGERQRVAIARALVNTPDLLLADEPTGNLDEQTGDGVLEALLALRAERGLTLILVTHDPRIAAKADRVVRLHDGVVVGEDADAA